MLATTPKRNPESKNYRSDAHPRPSEAILGPGESFSDVILRIAAQK
jgi:hypothetical protein